MIVAKAPTLEMLEKLLFGEGINENPEEGYAEIFFALTDVLRIDDENADV